MKNSMRVLFVLAAQIVCLNCYADKPGDEALNPRAAEFFAVPDKAIFGDTVTVGLRGLNAPPGTDFLAYGRAREIADATPVPQEATRTDKLLVRWDIERIECWVMNNDPDFKPPSGCATPEEAAHTLQDNAELLARYRQLRKLPIAPDMTVWNGASLINLTKLTTVQVRVALRQGNPEEAFRAWADNHAFLRRMSTNSGGWVSAAINLVDEGLSLEAGEAMLHDAPGLIENHYDEIMTLLAPGGIERFNLDGIARGEYNISKVLWLQGPDKDALYPNYITNRLYANAMEMRALMQQPPQSIKAFAETDSATAREMEISGKGRFDASAALIKGKLLKSTELLKSMHSKTLCMNVLAMRARIARDKVSDAGIPAYLASHDSQPLHGRIMQWDPRTRKLYYDHPEIFGLAEARL